jgi:hypothetical protein
MISILTKVGRRRRRRRRRRRNLMIQSLGISQGNGRGKKGISNICCLNGPFHFDEGSFVSDLIYFSKICLDKILPPQMFAFPTLSLLQFLIVALPQMGNKASGMRTADF